MSSILIKGMTMPKNCDECKFFAWKREVGQHCAVDDRITFHATIDGMDVAYERNGNCPLIELPPHGDLIDRKALCEDIEQSVVFSARSQKQNAEIRGAFKVYDRIKVAPIVVESVE